MEDRNQSYNWTYIGFDGSLSTGIGGKDPGLTCFILRGKMVMSIFHGTIFLSSRFGREAGGARLRIFLKG
jgi:hypothetical protein